MKLTDYDLEIRRVILAAGSLRIAAEILGCRYSSLTERMRRRKQIIWWRAVKAQWSTERRRARWRRAHKLRRERQRDGVHPVMEAGAHGRFYEAGDIDVDA